MLAHPQFPRRLLVLTTEIQESEIQCGSHATHVHLKRAVVFQHFVSGYSFLQASSELSKRILGVALVLSSCIL